MNGPLELRHFCRRFTLDDARAGTNPIRLPIGPQVNGVAATDLFVPPVLQYRYKERVYIDSKPTMQWSEWIDAPVVREGDVIAEPAP